jgi:hypothetical protein
MSASWTQTLNLWKMVIVFTTVPLSADEAKRKNVFIRFSHQWEVGSNSYSSDDEIGV